MAKKNRAVPTAPTTTSPPRSAMMPSSSSPPWFEATLGSGVLGLLGAMAGTGSVAGDSVFTGAAGVDRVEDEAVAGSALTGAASLC